MWCAFACEEFELFVDGAAPGEDYACCDLGRRRGEGKKNKRREDGDEVSAAKTWCMRRRRERTYDYSTHRIQNYKTPLSLVKLKTKKNTKIKENHLHHFNLLPPALIKIPNPLMNKSFLWSSQSTSTWLLFFRRGKQ